MVLPESDREDLAIQMLARSTTISDLSVRHGVSRKFVYQQARKAGAALDDAFSPETPEDEVLFQLTVTKMAAPGDRRADADLPQLVSRRRGVRA